MFGTAYRKEKRTQSTKRHNDHSTMLNCCRFLLLSLWHRERPPNERTPKDEEGGAGRTAPTHNSASRVNSRMDKELHDTYQVCATGGFADGQDDRASPARLIPEVSRRIRLFATSWGCTSHSTRLTENKSVTAVLIRQRLLGSIRHANFIRAFHES